MSLATTLTSPAELARARRDFARGLNEHCQILRPSSTFNAGGEVTVYTIVAPASPLPEPTIACRATTLNVMSAGEQEIARALQGVALWKVVLPALTDVRKTDAIVMGGVFVGTNFSEAAILAAGIRRLEVTRVSERATEFSRVVYAFKIGDGAGT